jgi:NAD(P)H-hydrate epimerase
VDRIAMSELRIPGIVLMENAARGIAEVVLTSYPASTGAIAIACGPGNNGGDGFAVARHLANAGREVRIHLVAGPEAYPEGSDPAVNLAIVRAMGLELRENLEIGGSGLIVDAIFGTGLSREVREPFRSAIGTLRDCGRPVVAVDLPSGLDANTGELLGIALKAEVTATMVAPKAGFELGQGPSHVGRVEVVDIGVPPAIIDQVRAAP